MTDGTTEGTTEGGEVEMTTAKLGQASVQSVEGSADPGGRARKGTEGQMGHDVGPGGES